MNKILLCIIFCQTFACADLFEAVCTGNAGKVEALIREGAKVNAKDAHMQTPLIHALDDENKKIATILIVNGADVNVCDRWGYSALMLACWSKDLVKMLVEKGADINFTSNDETALTYAASIGHPEIVNFLIDQGIDIRAKKHSLALIYAVNAGNKEVVQILCHSGVDINVKDELGYTALTTAIERGHNDIALYLVNQNIEVNGLYTPGCQIYIGMNFVYETRSTTLIAALKSENCSYSLIQGLIDAGANTNAQNSFGETALTIAVRQNDENAVDTLITAKVNLNLQQRYGYTAVMLAVYNNDYIILKKLLEAGADFHIKNNDGETALDIAKRKKLSNIVRLLTNVK